MVVVNVNESGPEFVVNAQATRANLGALEAINGGEVATVANGATPTGSPQGAAERERNFHFYLDRRAWLDAVRDDLDAIAIDAMKRTA
jgi:hypothetical protein